MAKGGGPQRRSALRLALGAYAPRLEGADADEERRSEAAFRIAQELLTNVERHSRARRVSIGLRDEGEAATLTVSDDGCGLDVSHADDKGRLGLLGIRERSRLLDGRCTFTSTEGGGLSATVTFPLPRPEGGSETR